MQRNAKTLILIVLATVFLGLCTLPSAQRGFLDPISRTPVIGGVFDWISSKSYHLGLDLRGGVKLVYDLDVSGLSESEVPQEVDSLIEFVRDRRVDQLGVSEPKIYSTLTEGQHHMVVELPGYQDDPEKAKTRIGHSVLLEFKTQKESFSREEVQEITSRNNEVRGRADDVLRRALGDEDFGELAREFTDDFDMKYQLGNYGYMPATFPEVAVVLDQVSGLSDDSVYNRVVETQDRLEIVKLHGTSTTDTERFRARHLLLKTLPISPSMTTEESEEAHAANEETQQKALDLLARIQAGESLESLARENTEDLGTRSSGGDLGYFARGVMVNEFQEALDSLSPGSLYDGLVKTTYGYHIIKLEDKQTEATMYNLSKIIFNLESTEPGQWMSTGLTGKQFKTAYVQFDQNTMQPIVNLAFDSDGADLFADITEANLNKPVAIFIDGALISAPTVRAQITDGIAIISGGFDVASAQELASNLNMGATPINFTYIGGSEISPSLGAESLAASLEAALIGYFLVALYMIAYYRLPGIVSVVALAFYGVLALAFYNILNVTLTLAGVAGFILSVGMAVDANILIFERIKEELASGKGISLSNQIGFERAWTSIRDSNISTLITCSLLLMFGSGPIRGFAFTLGIGVVISMFTAVSITRIILALLANSSFASKRSWYTPHSRRNS